MRHLIISRELPPATYPAGGIGAYVANISRLLAEHGDTVHVIGERWAGAPQEREELCDGRMVIHRIAADDLPCAGDPRDSARLRRELQGLKATAFPEQWFSLSAAFLAERLVQEERIDVIEAQEWEAPLYYFLLRRSLGLGPAVKPPCIVHLHSPSAFIHHFNGPASPPAGLAETKRMEEFCIRSADGLLCPSRSLARQVAQRYRLPADAIEVIPLPVGFTPRLERSEAVWSGGAICYVGRLEPRKGVLEWVDAAVRVAREDPTVHFDLVGADVWDLQGFLMERIGADLQPRFRFHGPKSKADIAVHLRQAKAGVVPSRWENFPNVCIEAMSSGLPVIATPFGGMVELLEDGRTGWIAADRGVAGLVDSLAEALRRCLAAPPERLAQMGAEAADAVRRICDNATVVAAHQRFRHALTAAGAVRSSLETPAGVPKAGANVVVHADTVEDTEPLLRSLAAQTLAPQAIAVVYRRAAASAMEPALGAPPHLVLHHAPGAAGTQAWNEGTELLAARPAPAYWLFLDQADSLEPDCLEQMAGVFHKRSDVGVVSPWTEKTGSKPELDARPSPAVAHQLTGNDVSPASGFRHEAIRNTRPFKPGLPRGYDVWALSNDVMARGWTAVTLPCLLARRALKSGEGDEVHYTALRALRTEALSAFDSEQNQLALQVVDAYVPTPQPSWTGHSKIDKPLRRFLLRGLEAILLRPTHTARRGLALIAGLGRQGPTKS